MNCSTSGLPILHYRLQFSQVHAHRISDAAQPSHPLMPSSPSVLNLSQHQGLFLWVVYSHLMTKILELQLQLQLHSFQWIFMLISLKLDWFDFLAVQGTFRSLLQHHSSKASILWPSAFLVISSQNHTWPLGRHSLDYTDLCRQSNISAFQHSHFI